MSIRPIRFKVTNEFRSDRSRKLRCRSGLFSINQFGIEL